MGDAFGVLTTGRWVVGNDGTTAAELQPDARRVEWRSVAVTLAPAEGGAPVAIDFRFPASLPAADDEAQVVAAGLRGLRRAVDHLQLPAFAPLTFHVDPDEGSKRSLTGRGGDGHAVPAARALHVVRADPAEGGLLEGLVAHEGTHVLVRESWGQAGSPLFGEGVAVWAAGGYAGTELSQLAAAVERRPIEALLGKGFFATPESHSYPFAALLVEVAVATVGLGHVREHLYGATARTWPAACEAAGTTASALQTALDARLGAG